MASDPTSSLDVEIAHILFMDIVGYTLLPLEEQVRLVRELQNLVRRTVEFSRTEARGELIRLPAGDGMALVFLRDPIAPVRCAIEIAQAVRNVPSMRLRMGIHTGPVLRGEDINAAANVAGGGVNIARRVMDCGDAGHILLSSTVAEILAQVRLWDGCLHDLGECEVKHGARLHLVNFYTPEAGNPSPPSALRRDPTGPVAPVATSESSGGPAQAVAPAEPGQQIALLYKRHAEPDEQLVKLLEQQLLAGGHRVFIDRHLSIGVEWAQEIERQVRTADAVVPLLSTASIQSEMLAYEVQIAHDAAQQQGKPRLLPVRVNYQDPLPPPLAGLLDPLEYTLWEGFQDNERLVNELLDALRHPPTPVVSVPPGKLEPVGGAVPLDSQFYVVRPTDEQFCAAIARRDSIVLVKGARQMGKTSLLARGLRQARESGARVVLTDLQKLNAPHLESASAFFQVLAEWLADQLDLEALPEETWSPRRGASVNFERYLRREVFARVPEPIVWGLDEVDRLFTCGFGAEVFGLFRSWHNERALDPTAPWFRLTLAIAYATEAHLFITDLNQSPFNVGTRLYLQEFTFEQVADLNRRYGLPLREGAEVARFHRLVSGHPYLVRRGLHEMATQALPLSAFEAQADRDEGVFGDHLRRLLVSLARDPELCEVVRNMLRGQPCPSPDSFYRLRSAGVIAGESARDVRPRCELYANYLERHLL